nr:hypothetical protein [Janthinobacterium sp. Marseille]
MNQFTSGFAPQQQAMQQQQAPQMAPGQPSYQQQLAAALGNQQEKPGGVLGGLGDVMSMIQQFQAMQKAGQTLSPISNEG